MSFFYRFSQEASNAFQDLYGNMCLGDDAGKSALFTLVLKPNPMPTSSKAAKLNLGMTFLEVNGRAYVQSVLPGSNAAKAGIMPQDAVQYACVFSSEWMQEEGDNLLDASELATQHALQAEASGVRITYDGLRQVLAEAMDPTQSAFMSPPTAKNTSWTQGPPIPSTVNVCVPQRDADGYLYNKDRPSSFFRGDVPRPVVFVFRRTRQRKSVHHMGMLLPAFRLDDECDFASSLVKRLAPTADMEMYTPDTWEELVHDGTDWLLGNGSMLPPKMQRLKSGGGGGGGGTENGDTYGLGSGFNEQEGDHSIPLDSFERERATKLANLRSKMAAEAMQVDRTEDVEAATIRGMIQKAVGLAFVRASKVVLGVSVHAGSGIVLSRLSDGTWSAPSAIGTWGLGLGLQFGLEVAEYIFILQTHESLEHFKSGGSFTIGGNMGVAVLGGGREAYGAASATAQCGGGQALKEDEYNDTDSNENTGQSSVGIAPIVAYAKSQGLYVGVSLEGSRIFVRNDINSRTYKFTVGRDVTAYDILSGKVPTPPEAEDLYAALHCVEFTHEMSCLPRPPEILRKDSANAWYYDRSTLGDGPPSKSDPFNFLSTLSPKDLEACETFETQFKKFMYGGVSVQRLLPNSESRTGRTGRERRTLWLMLPEVGSLRLGFVSKLSDGESAVSNKSSTLRARQNDPTSRAQNIEGDLVTVESEEVTLDSALYTEKEAASTIGQIRTGNVQLSQNHSIALTDLTILSHDPLVPIKFNPVDKAEHLRVISMQDVAGTSLLFLANNFREAELLVCGLKLLLERETARLGVRGGLPISALGGRVLEGAMSPTAARGFRDTPSSASISASVVPPKKNRRNNRNSKSSGYSSSDVEDIEDGGSGDEEKPLAKFLPEGRKSWGRVPGRDYMRGQAASTKGNQRKDHNGEQGVPQYIHGQVLAKDIAKKVRLPLPLPLCRVLLLDSTSPVIARWEKDRGDINFEHTLWTFPPATPRELERHASEHSLIATGSMCGAHRTTAFDRIRNGNWVRLSETQIVDEDDREKLAITVSERMPRRGFSIKVRILLRAVKDNACDATVIGEIRPVGKDMSNQAAVHKAFHLVLNEIKSRYGEEPGGIMAGFLSVIDTMGDSASDELGRGSLNRPYHPMEEKKFDAPNPKQQRGTRKDSGLVSFEDMLKTGRESPEVEAVERPSTPSLQHQIPEPDPSKRISAKAKPAPHANEFAPVPELDDEDMLEPKEPVLIEVKPLPKIRLSLMPSPREEDEDNDSSAYSPVDKSKKKKKNSSSKRRPSSSWRKSGRQKSSTKK